MDEHERFGARCYEMNRKLNSINPMNLVALLLGEGSGSDDV